MHISFCIYAVPHTFAKDAPPKHPKNLSYCSYWCPHPIKKEKNAQSLRQLQGAAERFQINDSLDRTFAAFVVLFNSAGVARLFKL